MATCKECGAEYLTKECFKCLNKEYMKNINNTYRKDNKLKKEKKSYIVSIVFITVIIIFIFMIFKNYNNNPLIGTWQTKINYPMIGRMKMEFTNDKSIAMGTVSKVDYEINDNNVIVTDKTGMGLIFKIIDKNTISYGMGKIRIKLYRVTKNQEE